MISTVYVEEAVRGHVRTQEILARVPKATVVACSRYGEVFNRRQQSFRLQKLSPSLILAQKSGEFVLPTPANYGVGGAANFYFSHMLNCPYDCRYCFLQGMYRSAHQVLFVNYEDFFERMEESVKSSREEASHGDADGAPSADQVWFFSGYDCDSLAFEGVSGFVGATLDYLGSRPSPVGSESEPFLELRTKSVSIEPLLRREPQHNVVVAYSLSPAAVAVEVEHRAPAVDRRIDALRRLQRNGWKVGLRFDPLLYRPGFAESYKELFHSVFSSLDTSRIHSVSLGVFRLPKDFHKRLVKLYPEEPLLAMPFEERDGLVSYREDLESELFETVREELLSYIDPSQYFPCLS